MHGGPKELLHGRHPTASYVSAGTRRVAQVSGVRGAERFEIGSQGRISVNESTADVNAALTGLGLVRTFGLIVQQHIERGALVGVLADWRPRPMPFHVTYRPDRSLSVKLRVFVD